MFCPYKNSYLQLICAMNPRVINKAVDLARAQQSSTTEEDLPGAKLESMQPSVYCPSVDITRANIGFGRLGLRILNRELHSPDPLVQLQALHSIMDLVRISENATFFMNLNTIYRLIDLMTHENKIIREKVCLILTHFASYAEGRKRIANRPVILDNLVDLILRDGKEIRYAAAFTLNTLSKDRSMCEIILKKDSVALDLLKMVKDDHVAIMLYHLDTLANLTDYNAEPVLRSNGFQIMRKLFNSIDEKIVSGAMKVMMQMCKHEVGKKLADIHNLTFKLRRYLDSPHIEVILSAVGILEFTTLTTRSKWRAKQFCRELTKRLVELCYGRNLPQLQLKCFQILTNLCDCPDIRCYVLEKLDSKIRRIKIRKHGQWDGTLETANLGFQTGHNYRTMCIEGVETIRNDFGDNAEVFNVHSYLKRVQEKKDYLIKAYNFTSYRD